MFKELPPEIPRLDDPVLALDLFYKSKDLISGNGTFDLCLRVSYNIISVRLDLIDPVHDVLPVSSLIEYHVSHPKFPVRLRKINIVSSVGKERGHAAPCDPERDHLPALRYLTQHRHIFPCIDNSFDHINIPFSC